MARVNCVGDLYPRARWGGVDIVLMGEPGGLWAEDDLCVGAFSGADAVAVKVQANASAMRGLCGLSGGVVFRYRLLPRASALVWRTT